jgi:hypothetical protein
VKFTSYDGGGSSRSSGWYSGSRNEWVHGIMEGMALATAAGTDHNAMIHHPL